MQPAAFSGDELQAYGAARGRPRGYGEHGGCLPRLATKNYDLVPALVEGACLEVNRENISLTDIHFCATRCFLPLRDHIDRAAFAV